MSDLDERHFDLNSTSVSSRRGWFITWAIVVQVVILAAVLLVHYQHMLSRLVIIWSRQGDWSHGFIIPFFSLYYLYLQRHRMPRNLLDRGMLCRLAGGLLLVLAFALYIGSTLTRIEYPKNLSLIISIMGIVMMVCGWPLSRWSWFAVAFLIFAMPFPQRLYQQLTMPLREVAAAVSGVVLSIVPGMEAEAQGTVVEYIYKATGGVLDIERACSGMRLLMTMTALGVAMAFIHERPLWQRMIMILACVPIAVFCNIIRVTTTGFFVVFGQKEWARGTPHTILGLGMLLIAFALYGGISYVLSHLFLEHDEPAGAEVTEGGGPP